MLLTSSQSPSLIDQMMLTPQPLIMEEEDQMSDNSHLEMANFSNNRPSEAQLNQYIPITITRGDKPEQ